MCRPQSTSEAASTTGAPLEASFTPKKPNKKTRRSPKGNNRRKRRPSSDESTTSTLSTVPSDESLDNSVDHLSPPRSAARSRRSRKSKTPPKTPQQVVRITELTPQQKSQYLALDAEMVGVSDRYGRQHSALARISLVDWNGEPIFDTYVRVAQPIVDYRTFVSGITPAHLRDEALPILEVRRIVGELIHGKIVVGHGLKCDFKALGLSHPWHLTRDSAKYQPFMKVHPNNSKEYIAKKLKTLAYDKLGLSIQQDGKPHDPMEDAMAAMELYKKHRLKWDKVVEWKMEKTRFIEEELNQSFDIY